MSDYTPVLTGGRHIRDALRARRGKRASSSNAAGKQKKGANCKTNALKKFWLTSPKAHKQKGYQQRVAEYLRKAGTLS